jgi:hypothetical protein
MAGTIVASTLSDGTNSTSTTNCIQGSAKAWLNFDGSGNTTRASYNVSSVTISGTSTTINFTNAFTDANYCAVMGKGIVAGGSIDLYGPVTNVPTTTAFTYQTTQSGGGALLAYTYLAFFR